MLTQRPRGTADLLPEQSKSWQLLEKIASQVFQTYNYAEVRTPIFEHTELFQRGVGETTDIVEKEMYTFTDRGGRSVTLRPEGTAGVVRAYVENKLYGQPGISKLYYIGPMFRYEKPQKGRLRQLHQYGCEVFGTDSPALDAEVIALNMDILTRAGASDLTVELNSVGCPICRPKHKEAMIAALTPYREELCKDCQDRLERNPLRIFDCKNKSCHMVLEKAGAPTILDSLCDDCAEHFDDVKRHLDVLLVPYKINEMLVRGLDYYTRTAWEVTAQDFGTVSGGGRYNSLVADVGGPETPGIGFAGGVERAILLLEEQGKRSEDKAGMDVYVALADETAESYATKLVQSLRERGIQSDRDYLKRSLKAQFKAADRARAKFVAVAGEDEVNAGTVTLKNLASGEQETVPVEQMMEIVTAQMTEPRGQKGV
ncbi:histidine--tRNA ligase [Alicyclobacillus sp. SO9]|uniref:histidine--tRNA ligase n=1 Tax=Alicyclobacillus sp. SO9 TaxID=2665646 RepID=UPI0018E8C3D5|nr:histidine--tRNA ligase [Alicyclobacillus sp. SO9]QQE81345.1 histidine--tRNA ligase [Alicyclobacillus sp. SO9]